MHTWSTSPGPAHVLAGAGRDALLADVKAEHIAPEELAESPWVADLIDDIESPKQTHTAPRPARTPTAC
jgi:hypothetical protein